MGPLEIAFGNCIIRRGLWLGSLVFAGMLSFSSGVDKRLHHMVLKFIRGIIEVVLISDIKLVLVVVLHIHLIKSMLSMRA